MNMNNKADEERFVCDNWDNPEVKLEGKGKGKAPARKVVTKPKVVFTEDDLLARIAAIVRMGHEVWLAGSDIGLALRFYPMMDTKLAKMQVHAKTTGIFRDGTLADKRAKFTRRSTEVSKATAQAYMAQKRNEQTLKFEEVTPDTTVRCPKCKYTFRVGRRVAA